MMKILHNGAAITDVTPGGSPIYVPGFAMVPAERQNEVHGMPGRMLQVRADGVDIGNGNPAVLDLVLDQDRIMVTRGVGENSHIVTLRALPPKDPCFHEVVLLMQRGVLVDTSGYARSLSIVGSGVTTLVAEPLFPGGLGIQIQRVHNGGGILTPSTANPEWTIGAPPVVNFRGFVRLAAGSISTFYAQILYNDGIGFNGLVVFIAPASVGKGYIGLRVNGAATGYLSQAADAKVLEDVPYYVEIQFYADGSIRSWVGSVASGFATGGTAWAFSLPASIDAPTVGPFVGYVQGSGGLNDFILGPWEVTRCERQPAGTTSISIPTALFPE